jgi:hypothetical protein
MFETSQHIPSFLLPDSSLQSLVLHSKKCLQKVLMLLVKGLQKTVHSTTRLQNLVLLSKRSLREFVLLPKAGQQAQILDKEPSSCSTFQALKAHSRASISERGLLYCVQHSL